jgi:hypothetical protein
MDVKRKTYLADEYSKNWMENADKEGYGKFTLFEQFETVSFLTNKSEPQYFGDMSIGSEDLSHFMGAGETAPPSPFLPSPCGVAGADALSCAHLTRPEVRQARAPTTPRTSS